MTFRLPELPYSYDALAPCMSSKTLEYHDDKHHLAYVENANRLIKETPFVGDEIESVVCKSYCNNDALFNNVSQHYNHVLFWQCMKKNGGGRQLPGVLQKAIDEDLGGYDKFRHDFIQAAVSQFGSGWVWLSVKSGRISITKTPNGESPLIHEESPILGLDVWEHSYYIDYYNDRRRYAEVFVDRLINWDHVFELFGRVG